jgi:MFS family permease
MVTYVAIPYQVKQLTGSFVLVGVLGLVELVPLVVLGLYGGALADAVDRRRMVLLTEVALGLMSAFLLVNALLPRPQLWPLYVFAFVAAGLDGLQRPSLDSLLPRIVRHDELVAASSLNGLSGSLATVAGPALGGILIATVGVGACYGLDVVTYAACTATGARSCTHRPSGVPPSPSSAWLVTSGSRSCCWPSRGPATW